MQDVLAQGLAPPGVKIPASIPGEGLWDLNVDSDLWMEIIQDSEYQNKDAPKWLCDEPTKQGIRAMLQLQRCEEELERLNYERATMYSWLSAQQEQHQLACLIAQCK
jgi:hypothetical protein